jgi:hypothetical protein
MRSVVLLDLKYLVPTVSAILVIYQVHVCLVGDFWYAISDWPRVYTVGALPYLSLRVLSTYGATLSHGSIAYIVNGRYSSLESALVQHFD